MPLAQGLNPTTPETDAKAFVAFLDSHAAINKKRKVGTTGYCMGGPIVMRIAAAVPDRVGAAASFHADAFAKAGLPAEIEVYAGAAHGWCPIPAPAIAVELAPL